MDESKKYAALLGYNYQSSDWYERSYKIINKNYKKTNLKQDSKKQKSLMKKFKLSEVQASHIFLVFYEFYSKRKYKQER